MNVVRHRVLPAQERMFVLNSLREGTAAYVIPFAVVLEGTLDVGLLRRAVWLVINRHEALLSRYVMDDAGVMAETCITSPEPTVEDVPQPQDVDAWIAARMRTFLRRPFCLDEEGPLRLCIACFAADRYALIMAVHHIAWDAQSGEIFSRELLHCYRQLALGAPINLPTPGPTLANLARAEWEWLASQEAEAQREWWRRTLANSAGSGALPAERGTRGRGRGVRAMGRLGARLTTALRTHAATVGVTTFAAVSYAVAASIGRRTGTERVMLGIPVSSRVDSTSGLIGPFINTLAITFEIAPETEVALGKAQAAIFAALERRALPYDQAVRGMIDGAAEAFGVLCTYDAHTGGAEDAMGVRSRVVHLATGSAQVDVSFHLNDEGDDIAIFVDVDSDRFLPATAGALVEEFRQTVAMLFANAPPSNPRPLLGAARQPVRLLTDVFAEIFAWLPDAIALREDGRSVTYAELDAAVGRFAGALAAAGIGVGDFVAILLPRSVESVVASLATWRAGGAFLPLEPADGGARLTSMLRAANPKVIVAGDIGRVPETWRTRVLIPNACGVPPPYLPPHPSAAAYVLFTSGSTGQPKGVVVPHAAIANRINWMRHTFPLNPGECVLHKSPLTFDVSLQEFLWPLASGAVSVVLSPGGERDPVRLMRAATAMRAVAFHVVPDMLRELLDTVSVDGCTSLRWVLCSGDVLPPDLAARFVASSAVSLINLYGPTETTIDVSWFVCDGDSFSVPIGRPVDNVSLSIRYSNATGQMPLGAIGELCIGGAQVGLGYLSARETADSFVPDPDGFAGARMYRTGDLCRVRADGLVEFRGRADRQVKVAGHRIELAEVEEALRSHSAVRDATVGVVDLREERHLIAWYVPVKVGEKAPDLRIFLRERLPAAAQPSRLVAMAALPLLSSGKLDRAALPVPELGITLEDAESPDGASQPEAEPIAQAIVIVWRELLGVEYVGFDDDFFELGGDSLRALQSVVRARRRGIVYTLSMLIDHPTPQSLATVAARVKPGLTQAAGSELGEVPLVPAQVWFFNLEHARHDHWNLESTARMVSAPRYDRLVAAATSLAHAHEALRLRFRLVGEDWQQTLSGAAVVPVEVVEIDGEVGRVLLSAVADELHATLSLEHGPLAAVLMARDIVTGEAELILIVHHLVSDAFSMGLLMDDLIQAAWTGLPVPERPGFARWARSALALPSVVNEPRPLPHDLPFALMVDYPIYRNRIADAKTLEQSIVGNSVTAFRCLRDAQRLNVLVAAIGRAICTLTDEPVCLLEVERHGREDDSEAASTVGWLTKFVKVVVRGGRDCTPEVSLRSAEESQTSGQEWEGRAEVMVNYLGSAGQENGSGLVLALGPSTFGRSRDGAAIRSHLLEIDCWLSNDALLIRWTYGSDVHAPATLTRLAAVLADQIDRLSQIKAVNDPDAVIEAGVQLAPGELAAILDRFARIEGQG